VPPRHAYFDPTRLFGQILPSRWPNPCISQNRTDGPGQCEASALHRRLAQAPDVGARRFSGLHSHPDRLSGNSATWVMPTGTRTASGHLSPWRAPDSHVGYTPGQPMHLLRCRNFPPLPLSVVSSRSNRPARISKADEPRTRILSDRRIEV